MVPTDPADPTRATAYHEAGHAVMAFVVGRDVGTVELTPGHDRHRGIVTPPPMTCEEADCFQSIGYDDTDPKAVIFQVQILLAGGISAEIKLGSNNRDGCGDDFEKVNGYAQRFTLSPDEAEAFIRWAELRTRNELTKPWTWAGVRGVAEALLAAGRLTRVEARDAYSRAMDDPAEVEGAEAELRERGLLTGPPAVSP